MCCIDICVSMLEEETVKAQVSITCVPWVFIILSIWPVERGIARPWRARMVVGAMFNMSASNRK